MKETAGIHPSAKDPGRNGFPCFEPAGILRVSIDLFEQSFPHIIILSGQKNDKFVSSDPEYRTVAVSTADLCTGFSDAVIADFMPVQIIDGFQIVDITDDNCKRLLLSLFDRLIDLNPFTESDISGSIRK